MERPRGTTLPGTYNKQSVVLELTGSNVNEQIVWINDTGAAVRVTKVSYIPDAAVTGDDTNNFALQLRNKGSDGAGTTGVSDLKTYASGVDIATHDEDTLVVSSTVADTDIADGDVLALNKTVNGSGLTMPQGKVTIEFQYR